MLEQTRLPFCLALSLAWLGGCQAGTKPAPTPTPSPSVANEARVPLVKPLPLVAMDAPMRVEFTLPPPGKSSSSTLFLGVRVRGEDGLKSLDAARQVLDLGLPAELKLERLEPAHAASVPLVRVVTSVGSPARIEAIEPNGYVAGGWLDNVDHHWMQSEGLEPADSHFKQIALAWAQAPEPGRYRLSLRLLQPDGHLSTLPAELLVAYAHQSK